MNDFIKPSSTALTPQQQVVRRKLGEDMVKILNRRPTSALDRFARSVAQASDWMIDEQPVRALPFLLSQSISLQQRDVGNALIEETRALNNQYVGCSFRTATVILADDADFLDLHARVQAWSVEVAKQLIFKLRHQARKDPYRTFFSAYDAIVAPLDTTIVHGHERLYSLVWETAVDLLPYQLLDAMLLQPGHCKISHDTTPAHVPALTLARDLPSPHDRERLTTVLSLYAVESVSYMDKVVLNPLLAALRQDRTVPGPEERDVQYQQMFADLLEAYPYLLSSDRAERYIIRIPGTTCVAAFSFLAPSGCARIMFADDVEKLRQGLHTNFVRGALNIGYEGQIQWWMHPWRTLRLVFGDADALTLSWWLLKQVHGQMVKDYLSIERYYLHGNDAQTAVPSDAEVLDETLLYVALARASEQAGAADDCIVTASSEAPQVDAGQGSSMLPQLRRRYFFKLLERCGVEVAQGKGSEIKLLRKTKRPFRLGSHYGSNPTIPAFLAASILKRLDITREEWIDALATG
jgi:hypothetical protein